MAQSNSTFSNQGSSNLKKRLRLGEDAIRVLLIICSLISILTTLGVIFALSGETLAFFRHPDVSLREFFTGREWIANTTSSAAFGVAPLVVGTLLITFIALLFGIPLGLGSAIYLSEFASNRVRRIIMPILEILAGVPTVVLGYFALFTVSPFLATFVPDLKPANALAAGIVMGFMLLPTISSISVDAMRAVPDKLRQAAYGLGATKGEVTTKVVLPAALSGIVAAIILAMSRAIGETMLVTLAAGQQPNLSFDPRETFQTMTSYIVSAAKGEFDPGTPPVLALYAVGATLFLITLMLNIISDQIVRRFREKYD